MNLKSIFRWKDFLYFQKNDRIAIILLLVLIVAGGGIYFYLGNFTGVDPEYFANQKQIQSEFTEFEKSGEIVPITSENSTDDDKGQHSLKATKNKTENEKLITGQTVDLNAASEKTLMRIPGIGAAFAQRIIEYRMALGGFADLSQLQEIKGITTNKYSKILPYIVIKKKHKTIGINKVREEQLAAHPYFEEKHISVIIALRNSQKIGSIDELLSNSSFSVKDIEKMQPYLHFD